MKFTELYKGNEDKMISSSIEELVALNETKFN